MRAELAPELLAKLLFCKVQVQEAGWDIPALPKYSLFNNGVCFPVHLPSIFLNEIHHNSYTGSRL